VGGSGGYVGTTSGVVIMTVLVSLLTILHMHEAGRLIIQGSVIIILLNVAYSKSGNY
jgi:ribose transport system permease protein